MLVVMASRSCVGSGKRGIAGLLPRVKGVYRHDYPFRGGSSAQRCHRIRQRRGAGVLRAGLEQPGSRRRGNSHSAMRQADSQLRFSFETASGTAGTGSGYNDQDNAFSAIAIAIQGTAGESGAVTLNLSAGGANLPGPPGLTLIIVINNNETSYPATQNNIITGLSVGDQFAFFGGLIQGSGNSTTMSGTLSVGPA